MGWLKVFWLNNLRYLFDERVTNEVMLIEGKQLIRHVKSFEGRPDYGDLV